MFVVCFVALAPTCALQAQNAPERAQKALKVIRETVSSGLKVADYSYEMGTAFKDARLALATKRRIVPSLPRDFFDDVPSEGSTEEASNKSQLYDLAFLPGGHRLYALIFDNGRSNSAIAIVEVAAHRARFLGEAFGWGLRAIPMPGEPYPILVIPQHMSAATTSVGGLLLTNGIYDAAVCGCGG